MTPRREVVWLDVTAPADELRRRILDSGMSRYLLGRRTLDNLVGVARAQHALRDLAEKGEIGGGTCEGKPIVVIDTTSALQLLERFRHERNHFAVIVDVFGCIQGVATPTDLLEAIAGALPETGDARLDGEKQTDGAWLFDGSVETAQAFEAVGLTPPESLGYATLTGYILLALGRLPQPGESFERDGSRFEIVSLDGRRIEKVRMQRAGPDPDVLRLTTAPATVRTPQHR